MNLKPQCETQEQLFIEMARVCKMCEGTNVNIMACVKFDGYIVNGISSTTATSSIRNFDHSPNRYEFAIAIIEGKPVFRGDELYTPSQEKVTITGYARPHFIYETALSHGIVLLSACSWNPPLPKTVMVELTIEDVKAFQRLSHISGVEVPDGRLAKACQKALDSLK